MIQLILKRAATTTAFSRDEMMKVDSQKTFTQHPHWPGVLEVAKSLRAGGFQAWLAGGCVRDLLLSRTPNDFDVVTDALPEEVEKLFAKSIAVGKAFGVIAVPFERGYQIEISTFREDGEYHDGRHPEKVTFSNPLEDAKRRDFTINAMFYDLERELVVDHVDGQKDLEAGVIRCVGDPSRRFAEDQLRLLRAVRFAAQLGFQLERSTWAALCEHAEDLHRVSRERIRQEWDKVLTSAWPARGLELLDQSGLWPTVQPAWKDLPAQTESWKTAASQLTASAGASLQSQTLRLLNLFGAKSWPSLDHLKDDLLVEEARRASQEWVQNSLSHLKYSQKFYQSLSEAYLLERLESHRSRLRPGWQMMLWQEDLEAAWLTGADLKKLGIPPGPQMGELLREAYFLQLEGTCSSKEELMKWVSQAAKS